MGSVVAGRLPAGAQELHMWVRALDFREIGRKMDKLLLEPNWSEQPV